MGRRGPVGRPGLKVRHVILIYSIVWCLFVASIINYYTVMMVWWCLNEHLRLKVDHNATNLIPDIPLIWVRTHEYWVLCTGGMHDRDVMYMYMNYTHTMSGRTRWIGYWWSSRSPWWCWWNRSPRTEWRQRKKRNTWAGWTTWHNWTTRTERRSSK